VSGASDAKAPAPTLYRARVDDPRDRAALPIARPRGRAPAKAKRTSDVTRFRGVLLAALAGAVGIGVTSFVAPPAAGPGALGRPHAKAKLTCANCHHERDDEAPATNAKNAKASKKANARPYDVPSSVCEGCHGAHPSTRPGHVRARAEGTLTCASCHTIHKGEQGVWFAAADPSSATPPRVTRFVPGLEVEVAASSYRPAHGTTVPIPRVESCSGCHAPSDPRDPIQRCLLPGQEALGGARPIVCFEEHQPAYPSDDRARKPQSSGVCGAQHTQDRAIAWDAARAVVLAAPTVEQAAARGGPWATLGIGSIAAILALGLARGGFAFADRRRDKRKAAPTEAMPKAATRVRLPTIDTATCLGCYACVDACPYDVLAIERYVAVVARPEACCGLILCEQKCPNGSLTIASGEAIGERPRINDNLESLDTPGIFLAGDVTGLPLIKNAIRQGALAIDRAHASLGGRAGDASRAVDVVIVGAGPAGLSAALRAKELGLSYRVIEQASVAQSIKSFPRGKLVFDQPLDVPVAGKLWLAESTKEELLAVWTRVVRQERLIIDEDTRLLGVRSEGDGFVVTTGPGPSARDPNAAPKALAARRVVIAIGQRGSPRRLDAPIPEAAESRVHYHLSDARSFEGKRIIVVGLGDVAMETATALARQPGTTVTLVHRGSGFSRGNARNVAEVQRLVASNKLTLLLSREVRDVTGDAVALAHTGNKAAAERLPFDALFVMIGALAPWSTLRAAGIRPVSDEKEPTAAPSVFSSNGPA
jgi:predicted CXXCH cytochrome family protein